MRQTTLPKSCKELKRACGFDPDMERVSPFGPNSDTLGDYMNNQYGHSSTYFKQHSNCGNFKAAQYFAKYSSIESACVHMVNDILQEIHERGDNPVLDSKPHWVANQIISVVCEKFGWKAGLIEDAIARDIQPNEDWVIEPDNAETVAKWEGKSIDKKVMLTQKIRENLPDSDGLQGKITIQAKTNVSNIKVNHPDNVNYVADIDAEIDKRKIKYELIRYE